MTDTHAQPEAQTMREIALSRNSVVFAVLIAITLISWLLGFAPGADSSSHADGGILLLLAFFKVRLVVIHFMEISHAPLMLRVICEGWIVISCLVLIAIYLDLIAI